MRFDEATQEYCLHYLLNEVGYFEWKLWAGSADPTKPWDYWVHGYNNGISVLPAAFKKGNSIYCTFLRQFSKDKNMPSSSNPFLDNRVDELEDMGYTVIRPSGRFEDLKRSSPL